MISVIGMIIGILVVCFSMYYLVKEKNDKESVKIYSISTAAGAMIIAVMLEVYY